MTISGRHSAEQIIEDDANPLGHRETDEDDP
jgi:hypothetical protein